MSHNKPFLPLADLALLFYHNNRKGNLTEGIDVTSGVPLAAGEGHGC